MLCRLCCVCYGVSVLLRAVLSGLFCFGVLYVLLLPLALLCVGCVALYCALLFVWDLFQLAWSVSWYFVFLVCRGVLASAVLRRFGLCWFGLGWVCWVCLMCVVLCHVVLFCVVMAFFGLGSLVSCA